MDRSADPTEHLPNSYVSRRSTEAQALSVWTPATGTLGELTDEAQVRAATLRPRFSELLRLAERVATPPGFAAALRARDVGIIAEIKRSSPSRGVINPSIRVDGQAIAYQRGGAAAVSILTEPTRFSGSNDDLTAARAAIQLPLLKKDFHVDLVQLLEAKVLGASAALLIVRAVDPKRFRELGEGARDIGLEIVAEVRDEAELELALSFGATIVGVNNRNLETLEIDPDTSARLLPLIPRGVVAIAESGVKSADDVVRLGSAGADAVLVGSAISASPEPEAAVRALTGIARTSGARKG
jgi:indole-3-glycerol phosphate synthase